MAALVPVVLVAVVVAVAARPGRYSSSPRTGEMGRPADANILRQTGWSPLVAWWSRDQRLHGAVAVVWSPALASLVAATGRLLAVASLGPVG